MLSTELLKRVESIFIRSRRRVTDVFSGEYTSAFRGRGIEFEEFREYVPGDDIRQIDWNVTARFDKPFVKLFREEREQTIFLIVDSSRSLFLGKDKQKKDVISEIAALLAYVAMQSQDKIGLIIFSDEIETFIAPKKGRAHVWNIMATLLSHKPKGNGTDINKALQFFLKVCLRKSICFLISDLVDDNFLETLRIAGLRHEVSVLRVLDETERRLPKAALMDFEDLEENQKFSLDLAKSSTWFEKQQQDQTQEMKNFLGKSKVDFLDLSVHEDYVEAMLKFFMKREKKR